MADQWNSYICKVNGSVASIYLNMALRDHAPLPEKTWLLWVWLYLRSPRKDGLSDRVELDTLIEIEQSLCEQMLANCRAILSGSITTEGRREFYYYGRSCESFEATVRDSLRGFDGYRFEIGTQEDPKWQQYLNVLYPSDSDLQRMNIRDVQ